MTTTFESLLPGTERALLHRVAVAQSEGRAPSFVGAVVREGALVWSGSRSCVDGHAPDADTQFRIGSITKVFTAVLVMRLRDEGLLGLDDPLEQHLKGTGVGAVTIAQLLGHSAGLAAETPGQWWERSSAELRPELSDVLGEEAFRQAPGRRHHYSNPGYTLLGSLVEAVRGVSWEEALRREILEPLGMDRTTPDPVAPHAGGWAVHPWADVMLPEPSEDLGLMAPAGQLWSTAADLARFAAFLAAGDDRVLAASTVAEMRAPAAAPGEGDWEGSYGLGLQLVRRDGRTLIGHSGSLPGFVAALWVSVEDGVGAIALANATSGPLTGAVAADLVRIVAEGRAALSGALAAASGGRGRRGAAGPGGPLVLGYVRLWAPGRPRARCGARTPAGRRTAGPVPGAARGGLDRAQRLLRGRDAPGGAACGRQREPSRPRLLRLHAGAVRA